jgi:hypothetical protein
MKIYIATHSKESIVSQPGYYLLQVGAENNKKVNIGIKDNTGDNISKKNKYYCELTGLYWIWKNSDEDFVGLVHYRRFFYKKLLTFNKKNVLTINETKEILNEYDIILPTMGHTYLKVKKQYSKYHDMEDLMLCGKIIKKKYPEYYQVFCNLLNQKCYYPFNMFITSKKNMDAYCEWLFDILSEAEKIINKTIDKKDKYNQRVYGFLSERLFNVWLAKQNYKIKELPVYNVEKNIFKEIFIDILKRILSIFRPNFIKSMNKNNNSNNNNK